MKKLYINFDFTARVAGVTGHFDGVKGHAIVNPDGSIDPSEYSEAVKRILYILRRGEDCVLITFGDGPFISEGLDKSYGRLIRHWGGGKLGYVIWDGNGNPVSRFDNDDGAVPDRKLAMSFLDTMIARHKRECGLEVETDS